MTHFATPEFWACYRQLTPAICALADKNFALVKADPQHPSVRLKKVGGYWSARVGLHYRAMAKDRADGLAWFWIGHHEDYERLIARSG